MFYKLIENKCNEWFESNECTVKELIGYMLSQNKMRDAQVEAIKIYLFLKIACSNKPLHQLFVEGYFNTISVDDLELTVQSREVLKDNPAAIALIEYSRIKDSQGKQLSSDLESYIKLYPEEINYKQVFFDLFYQVSYSDYLFSLPMGAGKTFLMAAFIYIDLFFAQNEPQNKAFAHNFIVFAPSGLKSSVVPSLKTIREFDPKWIIPNPAADELKKLIHFEVLDGVKALNKSNRTKNPNVQKINQYQPFDSLIGLVAVTNAEKVILDRVVVDNNFMGVLQEQSDDERDKQANELRNLIGKIPNLAIYIDEVHHAVSDEIKLRAVVNQWTQGDTINSVIGFSGTPYLEKAEVVTIADKYKIKNIELSNVVYYYPLIKGINNFLKDPIVKVSNNTNSLDIVESGVRDFLKQYDKTIYGDKTIAKLAVYCGNIGNLEEVIYPKVASIVQELGYSPSDVILKYHKGNKDYPISQDAETEYLSLDTPLSKKKIVLLVQIGKEGWDCKSLTGVVLSQKGDCPTNMVLQTSCRCLRQVDRYKHETALIWLNEFNAKTLNKQLLDQQNISLEDFSNKRDVIQAIQLDRYSRMDTLQLPPIYFFQLKVEYQTLVVEKEINVNRNLTSINIEDYITTNTIITQNFKGEEIEIEIEKAIDDEVIAYNQWLGLITRESFDTISIGALREYNNELLTIFESITTKQGGEYFLIKKYRHEDIRTAIRLAFNIRRTFETKEEIVRKKASLLKIDSFTSKVNTSHPQKYYPNQEQVKKIIDLDNNKIVENDENTLKAIEALELAGQHEMVERLKNKNSDIPERHKTYHYLPYRFDSGFEEQFMNVLKLKDFKDKGLEVYFNGDGSLTEFRIRCFKKQGSQWKSVGIYTPDFLIVKRRDGKIYQSVIVETKGQIYAQDPAFVDRKNFMQSHFIEQNNKQFGYQKFDYLYLENTKDENKLLEKITNTINHFFENN